MQFAYSDNYSDYNILKIQQFSVDNISIKFTKYT